MSQLRKCVSFCVLVMALSLGCSDSPKIETVVVPIEKSGLPMAKASESRMVVAIARRPDATWFFKLTGPSEEMNRLEDEWIELLKSVRFGDSGQPAWTLPKTWLEAGPSTGRTATLRRRSDQGSELEMAISSLGPEFDVLPNLNRWRGQLGLVPITEEQIEDEVGELEHSGGTFMMFDRTGNLKSTMTPPFAQGMTNPAPGAGAPPESTLPADPEIRSFEVPEGWTRDPAAQFVALKLEKTAGDSSVSISVTPMPAELNPWENSVASWIAETGGSTDVSRAVAERTQTTEVDGKSARRIDLIEEPDATKAIVGVRVEAGDRAWYIKLSGPRDATAASIDEFNQFLATLKL